MRLAPLLFCLGLSVPGLHAETWDGALAKLQAQVDAKRGRGMVVEVERVGVQRIRLRVQARGTTFHAALFRPITPDGAGVPVFAMTGKDMEALSGSTLVDAGTDAMEVVLAGPDLAPCIRLKVPALGQPSEVGTVMVGERIAK